MGFATCNSYLNAVPNFLGWPHASSSLVNLYAWACHLQGANWFGFDTGNTMVSTALPLYYTLQSPLVIRYKRLTSDNAFARLLGYGQATPV
jgi:hypothetical protein